MTVTFSGGANPSPSQLDPAEPEYVVSEAGIDKRHSGDAVSSPSGHEEFCPEVLPATLAGDETASTTCISVMRQSAA